MVGRNVLHRGAGTQSEHQLNVVAEAIGPGAIRDTFTLATALRAYHMAREGELPPELAKAMLSGV